MAPALPPPWTSSHLQQLPWPPAAVLRDGAGKGERSVLHIAGGNLFKLNFYAELANWWHTGQIQLSDVFDLACTASLKNVNWKPTCKNEEISCKIWISSTFLKKSKGLAALGLCSRMAAVARADPTALLWQDLSSLGHCSHPPHLTCSTSSPGSPDLSRYLS